MQDGTLFLIFEKTITHPFLNAMTVSSIFIIFTFNIFENRKYRLHEWGHK